VQDKVRIAFVCVVLGGLLILYLVICSVRENARTRQWPRSRAVVVAVELAPGGDPSDAARFAVQARIRTIDGTEITGWALDTSNWRARNWIGHEVDAWYDPADPRRFTLSPADSNVVSVLKGALMMTPVVVALAILALIYYLES
jgi:hypothetical protein